MKRVLWLSRHEMTIEQSNALAIGLNTTADKIAITKVDGTVQNVHSPVITATGATLEPLKEMVQKYDCVACVLPINLIQQVLPFMGDKPLISAKSLRVESGKNETGETQYSFVFDHWFKYVKIEVVTEKF